jgi:hypothetical protein
VFGTRGEFLLEVAGIALAASVGIVAFGTFIYSSLVMHAEARIPAIGFVTKPARAFINQVYDPAAAGD